MKQVEGCSKESYIQECIDDGGNPVLFEDMTAAMKAMSDLQKAYGYSPEVSEYYLLNDTNCDWVVMDDGTVLYRYYEHAVKESVNRARQKRYDAAHRRRITIDFFDPSERDILDKLASVPNKAGYIKKLIRDDIEREQANKSAP